MSRGPVKPMQMDDAGSQQCRTKCSGVYVCVYVCMCVVYVCQKARILTSLCRRNNVEVINMNAAAAASQAAAAAASTRTDQMQQGDTHK